MTAVTTPTTPAADRCRGRASLWCTSATGTRPSSSSSGSCTRVALTHEGYTRRAHPQPRSLERAGSARWSTARSTSIPSTSAPGTAESRTCTAASRRFPAPMAAGDAYARRHGLTCFRRRPSATRAAWPCSSQYAAENHVYSIPELARGGGIIFGAPLEFQNSADGLPALGAWLSTCTRATCRRCHRVQYWWLNTGQRPRRLLRHDGPHAGRAPSTWSSPTPSTLWLGQRRAGHHAPRPQGRRASLPPHDRAHRRASDPAGHARPERRI